MNHSNKLTPLYHYHDAFWHFCLSLIPFCMFHVVCYLNFITHPFQCPITHKFGTFLQLVIFDNKLKHVGSYINSVGALLFIVACVLLLITQSLVSCRKRDIRPFNAPIREFIFTKRHNVIMQGCNVFVIFTIFKFL